MKRSEKKAGEGPESPSFVPYRASKKQDFCLNAGLKILAAKRDMRRSAEEKRGIFSLGELK